MPLCYVKSIVHPPTNETNESVMLNFRPSEMIHAVEKFHKTPVYLGHRRDWGDIGQVRRLEHVPGGPLIAHMLISDDTETGRETIAGIRDGRYRAASMSAGVNKNFLEIGKCTHLTPIEISICDVPGRTGSDFLEFSLGDRKLYEIINGQIREKEPTEFFTTLYQQKKMETNPVNTSVTSTSRFETSQQGTTPVSASRGGESLETIQKRLQLSNEGLAALLLDIEGKARESRERNIRTLEKDWKQPRSKLEELPNEALEICADFNGNFQEMQAKLEARQRQLETEDKSKDSVIQSLRSELDATIQKLSQQKEVALNTADERFPVNAAGVRANTVTTTNSGDVGTAPVDDYQDINAAAGYRPAGIVAHYAPPSIFTNPKRLANKIEPYDYASVLRKAQKFDRKLNVADGAV